MLGFQRRFVSLPAGNLVSVYAYIHIYTFYNGEIKSIKLRSDNDSNALHEVSYVVLTIWQVIFCLNVSCLFREY
jgi:hypothetical protein